MFEGVVGRSCLSDIAIDGIKTETCGEGGGADGSKYFQSRFLSCCEIKKKKTAKHYQCITNFIHRFDQQLFHHFHIRAPHQERQRHRLLLSVSYQEIYTHPKFISSISSLNIEHPYSQSGTPFCVSASPTAYINIYYEYISGLG